MIKVHLKGHLSHRKYKRAVDIKNALGLTDTGFLSCWKYMDYTLSVPFQRVEEVKKAIEFGVERDDLIFYNHLKKIFDSLTHEQQDRLIYYPYRYTWIGDIMPDIENRLLEIVE